MITSSVETITPEIAKAMLALNIENRRPKEVIVSQYASDMLAGRWKMNGAAIVFDDEGQLNDGQHRLMALIKANTPTSFLVIRGVERDTRDTLDIGASRGAGDILTMFMVANGNASARVAKLILGYEKAKGKTLGRTAFVSKPEIIDRARDDQRIQLALKIGKRGCHVAKESNISFLRYVVPDSAASDAFFERLIDGVGLEDGSPILLARHYFARHGRKLADNIGIEALLRAWCAYRDGRRMSRIQIMGELPTP